jgi:hypothetical protein
MPYRYETHLHTSQSSACGVTAARDYIPFYQDQGYQGIFVTDHFFGGNTAVSPYLPWPEQVHAFCAGFEAAQNEGARRGFQVLFGWEQAFDGDEYLIYGLDKAWLLGHPEVKRYSRAEQYAEVTRYGGCVVQAHPFRDRSYIRRIHLSTQTVHGVEVFNVANPMEVNAQAYRYARNLNLPMLAGSDIHFLPWPTLSGVAFDTPLRDELDFAARVRNKAPIALIAPEAQLETAKLAPVRLPCEVLGEGGRVTDIPLQTLLRPPSPRGG